MNIKIHVHSYFSTENYLNKVLDIPIPTLKNSHWNLSLTLRRWTLQICSKEFKSQLIHLLKCIWANLNSFCLDFLNLKENIFVWFLRWVAFFQVEIYQSKGISRYLFRYYFSIHKFWVDHWVFQMRELFFKWWS